MQRLFNVDKWFLVADGKAVSFGNTEPRRVRLDVNSPSPAQLFYSDGDGNITFLANVHGRDVIEFASYGAFDITCTGSDCWMYTIDGEDLSFSIPDAVKLTKIFERRARNPELELMQHMMNRNIEMRMEAQRVELEQLWNRREEAARAAAALPEAPAANAAAGSEPVATGVPASGEHASGTVDSGGTTQGS